MIVEGDVEACGKRPNGKYQVRASEVPGREATSRIVCPPR